VRRVRKTALAIARTIDPLPDLLVVEIAALAHDMLDKKYVSADVAADPYSFFLPLLRPSPCTEGSDAARNANNINGSSDSPSHSDLDSDLDLIADGRAHTIARIVDNVSWTTEKKLRAAGQWGTWHQTCVELHCVQDADRLDAIGAFGIMRCAAYSSATNRPLHVPSAFAHSSGDLNDSAIQHFHDKLLHIRDRLKTGAGKRMGEKRHQFMLDFLAAIDEEYT